MIAKRHKTLMDRINKINEDIAVRVTLIFGTMWMTYLFFLYGFGPIIWPQYQVQMLYWSNTIQLWSLPLLMVGTNILGRAAERRAQRDHEMITQEFKAIKDVLGKIDRLLGEESSLRQCWEEEKQIELRRDSQLMAILDELRRMDRGGREGTE